MIIIDFELHSCLCIYKEFLKAEVELVKLFLIVFVLLTIKWDLSATNAKEKGQKGENKQ